MALRRLAGPHQYHSGAGGASPSAFWGCWGAFFGGGSLVLAAAGAAAGGRRVVLAAWDQRRGSVVAGEEPGEVPRTGTGDGEGRDRVRGAVAPWDQRRSSVVACVAEPFAGGACRAAAGARRVVLTPWDERRGAVVAGEVPGEVPRTVTGDGAETGDMEVESS